VGTNKATDKVLIIDKESLVNHKQGYIIGSLKTTAGDGTVTVGSATIDNSKTFIIEGSHGGILKDSIKHIADIYNLDKSLIGTNIEELKEYPLGIILKKYINIELKNENNIIGKLVDGKFITEYECIYQEFEKDYLWIMLKNICKGQYSLEAYQQYEEDNSIFIIGSLIEEELSIVDSIKMATDTIHFSFKV